MDGDTTFLACLALLLTYWAFIAWLESRTPR